MGKMACGTLMTMGVLTIGVSATAPAALCASEPQAPAVTLAVLVDDSAGVPAAILDKAREDASRVFHRMNVDIIWLEHDDARLEGGALSSLVVVRLLTHEMTARMHAPDEALGLAVGTGLATVFYNRIEDVSGRDAGYTASILGHVIAHEIGHLLLPPRAHSPSGIMQARLNTKLAARGVACSSMPTKRS